MKTKFRELVLLVTMYIAGALMCWTVLVIQQLNRDLEDPCHFEHIKGLSNDQNASGRFVYCTDRQLQKTSYSKDEIRYYFRYLDKNIKFSPDEQKIVDEAKKVIGDDK